MNTSDIDADHIQDLLKAHSRRLKILQVREATYGISCPPEIVIEIEDISEKIKNIQIQLKKPEERFSSNVLLDTVNQDTISRWAARLLADQVAKRVQFTAYDITLALRAKYPKLNIDHKSVQHSVHTMMRLLVELKTYRRVIVKYGKHQARRYEPLPNDEISSE